LQDYRQREGNGLPIARHTNCTNCERRPTTEWNCLTHDELRLLDNSKIDHELGVGENIYVQGDPCNGAYCIRSGLIGLRRVDAMGHSLLMRLVNPGETIGYRALLSKTDHTLTAEVMMPSKVCFISRATIQELLARNPALGMRFLDHSLQDIESAEEKVMGIETWTVRTRFLHLLMVLYERFGEKKDDCWSITLPISRRDLAELVGATPETMSRTIKAIQAEGLASFKGRRVIIPDLDALLEAVPFSY
jgi:CRP-like cAMP-binding protein